MKYSDIVVGTMCGEEVIYVRRHKQPLLEVVKIKDIAEIKILTTDIVKRGRLSAAISVLFGRRNFMNKIVLPLDTIKELSEALSEISKN